MNYLAKIFSHSKWTLGSAVVTLLLQLVLYYFIANKVDAADLGHYFLVSALIFIPAGIMEFSFVSSLIHEAKPLKEDYGAVFRINIFVSITAALVGLCVSFLMASYYEAPELSIIYLWLLPILFLAAYTSVQNAGLKKNLEIRKFAIIELIGVVVTFIMTLLLLFFGFGIYALIIGQLVKYLITTIILFSTLSYLSIPKGGSRSVRAKHWNYGKYALAEKSLGIGMSYLDTFLVHHFLGAQVLGIYDLLKRIIMRPLLSAYNAIEQVVFPMLSNAESREDFRKVFTSFIRGNNIYFVAVVGIFLSPYILSFFPLTFGDYVYELQLLILLALSILIFNPVDIVCYSLGITKKFSSWVLCYSLVQIIIAIFALQIGLAPFLMAMIFFNVVTYLLSYFVLIHKRTDIRFLEWSKYALVFIVLTLCFIFYLN